MSIHVALHHKTRYTYDKPVGHGPHVVRLRPSPHCRTKILSYSQKITGGEHFINWQQDPFANWNARLVFPDKMKEFCVEVEVVAEMAVYNPFDFFLEDSAQIFPFAYDKSLKKELAPFMELPAPTPLLLKLVDDLIAAYLLKGARTNDFLVEVNQRIQHAIKYTIRLEPGVQSPEETLAKASGSCRDSGWLLVQILRSMGLAARFVSGYLIQLAPDLKSLDGPSGTEVDFTDLHAWCEVYLPGGGWIGLDPTSGLLAGEGHIPLSCTPEPSSAAPVTGAVDKCESKLLHEMKVTRVYESPRVEITVQRPGADQPRRLVLERQSYEIETVLGVRRKADNSWDYFLDPHNKIALVRLGALLAGSLLVEPPAPQKITLPATSSVPRSLGAEPSVWMMVAALR